MADLLEIRTFIENNLDYAPVNTTWRETVDKYINDVYFRIFTGKAYDFAQKIAKIPVYKDVSISNASWNGASGSPITIPIGQEWPVWCEGQVLEIDDLEFDIVFRKDATTIYVKGSHSILASVPAKVKNRYIDMPADLTYILNVSRRTLAVTARNVGQYTAVSRFEDEYHNLPLDEVSVPAYWIGADDNHTISPRNISISAVAAPAGQGSRSIQVALAFAERGANQDYRFSGLTNELTLALTDTQQLQVQHTNDFTTQGLYKAVFFRSKDAGYYTWRRLSVVAPDVASTETHTLSLSNLQANTFLDDITYPIYNGASGTTQRIRLYPRQDEDYELTVRYVYRPLGLNEDQDTPTLPPAQHMILAYAALEQLSMQTNNDSRAGYYHAKMVQMVEELDARYLTSPARRFVKGFMGNGLTNPIPMYTNLRRLP
tara:strand:+ start:2590 stop:3879 length:1290 start_codon:yes stop_codon:yes gene_type:complete